LSRVAIRYSKALFELAHEKGQLPEIEQDLLLIKDQINQNEEFQNFLINPLIQNKSKTELLKKTFKDSVGNLTMNFLVLTSGKKRSEFIKEIIERFEVLALEHNNIISAQVFSAVPLSSDQADAIRDRLKKNTGKEVRLEEIVEKSLLGGFIVKIRDSVTDYSLKRQLERLKEKMIFG
jgi:F-type H+-transporting ATPase subunit delta